MADADLALRDDVEKYASPNSSSHDAEKGGPYNHDNENERRSSVGLPGYRNFDSDNARKGSVTIYHDGFFSAFSPASFKRNPNARVVYVYHWKSSSICYAFLPRVPRSWKTGESVRRGAWSDRRSVVMTVLTMTKVPKRLTVRDVPSRISLQRSPHWR